MKQIIKKFNPYINLVALNYSKKLGTLYTWYYKGENDIETKFIECPCCGSRMAYYSNGALEIQPSEEFHKKCKWRKWHGGIKW